MFDIKNSYQYHISLVERIGFMRLRYFLLTLLLLSATKILASDDYFDSAINEFPERLAMIEANLEKINKNLEILSQRINRIDGEKELKKFESSVEEYEKSEILLTFFKRLAANIRSFRLASATISSGEVSVDQSMLYLSRSLSLGALEFLSTQGDAIPVLKSVVHNSVGFIENKIREEQLRDNEHLYHGCPDIFMMPFYEAHQIMLHLDYEKIIRKQERLESASKEIAKIWIKSCTKYLKENPGMQSIRQTSDFVDDVIPIFMSKILVEGNRFKRAKLWKSGVLGLLKNHSVTEKECEADESDEISL